VELRATTTTTPGGMPGPDSVRDLPYPRNLLSVWPSVGECGNRILCETCQVRVGGAFREDRETSPGPSAVAEPSVDASEEQLRGVGYPT
jgi:hypothetical protein